MRNVTNVLKERVLVYIDNVYYDSWGGIYFDTPKRYLDIPKINIDSKQRYLAFELIDESLMLFEICCDFDDNQVYFKRNLLTSYIYESDNKKLYSSMDNINFNMDEVLFGIEELERFITNILSKESFFNTLVKNKLIVFDEISIKNLFFIYRNGMNHLIELFAEKELFNILAIIINAKSKVLLNLKDKNWQCILPILSSIEKINDEEIINVLSSEFYGNRENLPSILEITSTFIETFDKQDVQQITRFLEVLNVACEEKRYSYQKDYLLGRRIIKVLNILENINVIGYVNKDLTKILNYLVKSIFNTYQCELTLKDITEYLSLYADYLNMREDINDESIELYPTFLKKAHDNLINILNNNKDGVKLTKEEKISFIKNSKSAKIYEYENDKYIVKAPRNYFELLNEGKELNHCVGGYSKLVARGKTNIMFVRYKVEESVPFMTLEIKNNQIIQAKKKNNIYPKNEEVTFLEEYAKSKGLTIVRY